MKRYEVVVLDLDMTIINTFATSMVLHKRVRDIYYPDLDIDMENEIRRLWGIPQREFWLKLFREKPGGMELLREKVSKEAKNVKFDAIGHAKDVLEELHKTHLLAVLTSASRSGLTKTLSDTGISQDLFDFIQTEEITKVHKPDPRTFDPLIEHFAKRDIGPGDMIYVGDDVRDYQAADGAGLDFVAVLTGFHTREDFEKVGVAPQCILCSIDDLPEYLRTVTE